MFERTNISSMKSIGLLAGTRIPKQKNSSTGSNIRRWSAFFVDSRNYTKVKNIGTQRHTQIHKPRSNYITTMKTQSVHLVLLIILIGHKASGTSGSVLAPTQPYTAATSTKSIPDNDFSDTSIPSVQGAESTQKGPVTTTQAPVTPNPGATTSNPGDSTVAPTQPYTAVTSTKSIPDNDFSDTSIPSVHGAESTQKGPVPTTQAPATPNPGATTSTPGDSTVAPTQPYTADISTKSIPDNGFSDTSIPSVQGAESTQKGPVPTTQAPATPNSGLINATTTEYNHGSKNDINETSNTPVSASTSPVSNVMTTINFTVSNFSVTTVQPGEATIYSESTSVNANKYTTHPSASREPSSVVSKPNQSAESTSPPNSTISITTSTVRATTSGPQESYMKEADKNIRIPMELSVNDTFSSALKDPNSKPYQNYKDNFTDYLTALYNDIKGFSGIEVTGFRNGSIVALYQVVLDNVTDITQALNRVNETVNARIHNTTLSCRFNLDVQPEITLSLVRESITRAKNICILYHKPCDLGYTCTCKPNDLSHYTCESKCFKRNKHCGQNGDCVINYSDGEAKCRCKSDDTYAYSGEFCEISTEKLKLETKYIIIIGASGGAAFLVIIVVLVICLLKVRSRNNRAKRGRKGGDKPDSHSMTDFNSLGSFEVLRSRTFTEDNQYDSGLPGTRVLKENSGSETYIYSPTSFAKKVDMTDSRERRFNRSDSEYNYIETENAYVYSPTSFTRRSDTIDSDDRRSNRTGSVYDQIDTESKFEIKRPNFRAALYPQL